MARKRLSVYQRIMKAAKNGTSLHISADEAYNLSFDSAIVDAAENEYNDSGDSLTPDHADIRFRNEC